MEYQDTTVIIPTLNEGKNISELLDRLSSMCKGISIIVSDDGSKDNTQETVKLYNKKYRQIHVLDRSDENIHGLTASVIDAAKKVATKYLVVMDGDMQHPPEKVREIVNKLRKGYDIVVGVRRKVHFRSFFRLCMSKTALLLGQIRLLLNGVWCRDIVSGFFGVRTELFQNKIKRYEKKFQKSGYKVLFDLLKLMKSPAKIGKVLYTFGERAGGSSKINKRHILIYLKSIFT